MILFNFGTFNQKQGEMRWFMKVKDQKSFQRYQEKIRGKLFLEYDNQRQIDINHTWQVKMRQLST